MNRKIQLFLLPFAGGSSISFNKLIGLLDERIDSYTVEYPGRGSRSKEEYIVDYEPFLYDVIHCIESCRNEALPYALLGYSMGSALAFDIAARDFLTSKPSHLFVCARGSLKEESPSKSYALLSENDFADKIINLGGIDSRIAENKRFRDIYFKPLRADYSIWSKYKYLDERKVSCNITVMYSDKDETCINPQGWAELTKGTTELFAMGQNHFFINEHYPDMATIINKRLLSLCGEAYHDF